MITLLTLAVLVLFAFGIYWLHPDCRDSRRPEIPKLLYGSPPRRATNRSAGWSFLTSSKSSSEL